MKGKTGAAGNLDFNHDNAAKAHCDMINIFGTTRDRATKKSMLRLSRASEANGKWKENFQPDKWHALVDVHTGKKIKYAAMSFDERKRRNLVTYPFGLCWKRCDPP